LEYPSKTIRYYEGHREVNAEGAVAVE